MNTLTIRNIPLPVEQSLRRIARESHKSINKTAIELLAKATGVSSDEKKSKKKRNISNVFPVWSKEEYQEFTVHTRPFESIDEELWH